MSAPKADALPLGDSPVASLPHIQIGLPGRYVGKTHRARQDNRHKRFVRPFYKHQTTLYGAGRSRQYLGYRKLSGRGEYLFTEFISYFYS